MKMYVSLNFCQALSVTIAPRVNIFIISSSIVIIIQKIRKY